MIVGTMFTFNLEGLQFVVCSLIREVCIAMSQIIPVHTLKVPFHILLSYWDNGGQAAICSRVVQELSMNSSSHDGVASTAYCSNTKISSISRTHIFPCMKATLVLKIMNSALIAITL